MKKSIILSLVLLTIILAGCSGKYTEKLPQGQKLVTVSWKNSYYWYLTRPMKTNEVAETYTFHKSSSWGITPCSIDFVETK